MERRFQSLTHPQWVEAMTIAIFHTDTTGYFRWHDSGDLQGGWHLDNIVQVARNTPDIRHWLPTHEHQLVRRWAEAGGVVPENLTIRLSANYFDREPPVDLAKAIGVQVSGASKLSYTCPSLRQNNQCGRCRLCWDKNTFNVTYHKH